MKKKTQIYDNLKFYFNNTFLLIDIDKIWANPNPNFLLFTIIRINP